MDNKITPIYIISGFLGSGKTTLLTALIRHWKQCGLKPAIVMNEIGEVNIDGAIAGPDVPSAELLGGCICCSIKANLASELALMIREEQPDVVAIEATGAANPMEILDAVADASLYMNIELKSLITVVDAAHLLEIHESQGGRTYRLMQEQIRAADMLILNKTDRIDEIKQNKAHSIIRSWNAYASIMPAVRCDVDLSKLLGQQNGGRHQAGNDRGQDPLASGESEHLHSHVMSLTYYIKTPVDSLEFEKFIKTLPREVYRAKGILTFSDTASRFLFQYAYRETDYMKVEPGTQLPDVIVLIGEHFNRKQLEEQLIELENSHVANRQ